MSEKIGRNEPCWCGSGKKYKSCHRDFDEKIEMYKSEGHIVPSHKIIKTPAQIEREEAIANCDHFCHSDNELIQMFWNIINLFCRLFGIEQYCECGDTHYSAPLFG